MRWTKQLSEGIKKGIRSWLNITPASPYSVQIQEVMDFELNAIRNRIWYRGDSNELEQLYQQSSEYADKYKFWASRCTQGMEMRKIHTGLPSLIVRILNSIVLADMNEFEFEHSKQESLWSEIEKENKFRKKLEKSLKEVLYIGDGAFKITLDTTFSPYPILEWYSGDRIEVVKEHDRLKGIIFKTPYTEGQQQYVLHEYYGYGTIHNELYRDNVQVTLTSIEATKNLHNWKFDENIILAVPLQIYESSKYEGRGGSIFDGKLDSFDAFDEAWSQWMDALRAGRAKVYVPDCFIKNDPNTGRLMKPNPFDNRFILGDTNMGEGQKNEVKTVQPEIPHDSYLASYITALDQCLQGIISPSTIGIDVKKLDNAEAQREKEKATLYTRNAIIEALQETLPDVVATCINAYHILFHEPLEEVKVNIPFGEYANPSFESQIETVVKARQGGIMSIERSIEELYGDSLDEHCKQEEITRLKQEQGIAELEEPSVNLEGVEINESQSDEQNISDEPTGVQGTVASSQ